MMKRRVRRPLVGLLAAALSLGAVAGPALAGQSEQATKSKTYTVKLQGIVFSPKTLKAKVGDKVKFVWVSGVHNVVSEGKAPARVNSGAPVAKDNLTITLKKGTYKLVCIPHKSVGMRMTITVT
jgi:plastocyanin